MIGPSSSHTAGVVRLGLVAHKILEKTPSEVTITFYNSFASTYQGHGSDKAVIGGLLGFKEDDKRIRHALKIAREKNMPYNFKTSFGALNKHPNTLEIEASNGKEDMQLLGESTGGGKIMVKEVNHFDCHFSANAPTLLIFAKDEPGSVAKISALIAGSKGNIASMTLDRNQRDGEAMLAFVLDHEVRKDVQKRLSALPWVRRVLYVSLR